VSSVTCDTRKVTPGSLYCCIPGSKVDGHSFAAEAVRRGAVALLCERTLPPDLTSDQVAQVCVGVGGARAAMAQTAATLWGRPSEALRMVGVTGTSGKTTVTHLLAAVLEAHGWPTAVIGTLGGSRTTPEAPVLQESLARHRDSGAAVVAMEVSSHALVARRVDAIRYDVVAFTNLSHDHLDFHQTMEAYFEAKASLFIPERAALGLANMDDPWGARLIERNRIPMQGYSVAEAGEIELGPTSSRFKWRGHPVRLRLGGSFNVANAVAAARIAEVLGVSAPTIAVGLSNLVGIAGRFEALDRGQKFSLVVDYAHKPEALARLLDAVRQGMRPGARLIVVFGCGGDRDRTKRPIMGEVATRLADLVVITSDNPRSENAREIIDEIRAGARLSNSLIVEVDRAAAIALAVAAAQPGDAVVIAGKGHETVQETRAGRLDFDDRLVAAAALDRLLGATT
jgi:UDP-N-acetylmuramoyl-L-alanyl-D-glutamate--2,6-diaminopimelate ligase